MCGEISLKNAVMSVVANLVPIPNRTCRGNEPITLTPHSANVFPISSIGDVNFDRAQWTTGNEVLCGHHAINFSSATETERWQNTDV